MIITQNQLGHTRMLSQFIVMASLNALVATGAIGIAASPLHSQRPSPRIVPSRVSAAEMLITFEQQAQSDQVSLASIVRHPHLYPAAKIDSLMSGLEGIALRSTSQIVRGKAANALTTAGTGDPPVRGALQRALRVYRTSRDDLVRRMILGSLYSQKEREAAISFLKQVASQDEDHQDFPEASLEAVSTLSYMGADGRAALVDLRSRGAFRDPAARGWADWYFNK